MLRMLVAEAPSWSSLEPVDGVLLVRSRVSASSELLSASSPSTFFLSLAIRLCSGRGSSQRGICVIPSWLSCSMKYSMISFPCGSLVLSLLVHEINFPIQWNYTTLTDIVMSFYGVVNGMPSLMIGLGSILARVVNTHLHKFTSISFFSVNE